MHYDSFMSTITIKNVPPVLHRAFKARANAHGRSLNKEIIATLENTLRSTLIDGSAVGMRARAIREEMGVYLTQEDLTALKKAGRR